MNQSYIYSTSIAVVLIVQFWTAPVANSKTAGHDDRAYALSEAARQSLENGNNDQALLLLEEACKVSPLLPEIHNNIALSLMMAGRYNEAEIHLKNQSNLILSMRVLGSILGSFTRDSASTRTQ